MYLSMSALFVMSHQRVAMRILGTERVVLRFHAYVVIQAVSDADKADIVRECAWIGFGNTKVTLALEEQETMVEIIHECRER